jgi:multisubunit Na+/H+ antiporter MnhB subunit
MGDTQPSSSLVQLRALLTFLSSLWGLMAGISALFPLSSQLLAVIPLASADPDGPGGGLRMLEPAFVTGMATFASLFMLMYLVTLREEVRRRRMKKVRRQSLLRFLLGILAIVGFISVYTQYEGVYSPIVGRQGELPSEWFMAGCYILFFVSSTYAFTLLGLKEFMGHAEAPVAGAGEKESQLPADR